MVVRTVDTDMLVRAVSVFEELKIGIWELWVDFGAGKNRKFVPIHENFQRIGELKARGLPFLYAFTGCDQILFLSHVTKYTAWKVCCLFDTISNVFSDLSQQPTLMQIQETMSTIERFTVLLYHETSNCSNTNEYRRELFCQGRSINNIPPTSATLWIHTFRSCYIAGHVPTQEDWGWKFENNKSIPHWTYFPEAVDAIRDLIKCACKPEKSCRGWCKCVQSQLLCTELCVCKGQCERE